jgi:hypothetical protein
MKPWAGSGRRRGILLFASCSVPLLFIAFTTSFFYPDYFDKSFLSRKPVQTSLAPKPDTTDPFRPWESPQTSSGPHTTSSVLPEATDQLPEGWAFDTKRDERHYGLNEAQCDAAFPDFYQEIDRAVAFRQEKDLGDIREEDVDIEWREGEIIRIMLYDRQVRFTSRSYVDARANAYDHSCT